MPPDFSGNWTADLSQSKLLGPQPKAICVKIQHREPELSAELSLVTAAGADQKVTFRCSTNGDREKGLLNGQPVRSAAHWAGDELVIETWLQQAGRELYFCDCWSLDSDTQTLVMEHRNDALAGQRSVLRRTP